MATGAPAASPVPSPLLQTEDLPRAVWQLAWPSVLTMMLQLLNGLVDMFFVGRLGPPSQAAVGLGSQVVMLLMGASMAVSSGATAIVARYVGAGDRSTAAAAARQALLLAGLLSFALGIPLWFLQREVLLAMGAAPEVLAPGQTYLAGILLAVTPYFILLTLISVFQGYGDMRTPLAIMLLVNGANIAGDCLLIPGWGPFPSLGVLGAAVASSSARLLGAVVAALWIGRIGIWRAEGVPACGSRWRPSRAWFRRILRIGNPVALQQLLRSMGATSYTRLLADSADGTAAVAALFVGLRAEGLGYMPAIAYGRAASTLVGQSLGARQPERAERSGWLCTWQAMGMIVFLSVLFYVLAPTIAGWFSADGRVVALATSYLRINALAEPFLAFAIVLAGALQGAGDTRFQSVVSIVTMWVLRLPATYWFTLRLGYGAVAAWWTMAATVVVQGLLVAAWFRRGGWKSVEV